MKTQSFRAFALISFLVAASAFTACSSSDADDVFPSNVLVTNRSKSALVGEIESIDGVYGPSCAGHAENEAWSAAVIADAPLTHSPLRVRRNDASCTLEITHVRNAGRTFTAAPALALAGAFGPASAFHGDEQTPVDFNGSAKLGDPSFASNFTIELLVTDGGEPTEGDVHAPDFGISRDNHTLSTDEDDVVTESSGYLQLILNKHPAQTYAVIHGALSSGTSPEELASRMQSAPHSGAVSAPYRIPAADLDLVGVDLTSGVSRTIILRNTQQDRSAYQLIPLEFTPQPSWRAEPWGECSAKCGGGTQTRAVKCRLKGADVDPSQCAGDPPATSQACNSDPCGTWTPDPWGACSAACGGGTQTRVNRCLLNGSEVDASYCIDPQPATTQSCNEAPCATDIGAFQIDGSCGILGLVSPAFVLTAGPTTPLPAGTTIDITGSNIANIGAWTVSGGDATVNVLSPTRRQIFLNSALPAGSSMTMSTSLSITVAWVLNATVTLPAGFAATGAKTSGNITSTLILCSAS